MDYSIFLLDAFTREKKKGLSDEEAMVDAVDAAINSIFASSLTTIAGFVALMFMKFSIGFDMGLVLAKGIVFSLLTVVLFMPAMIFRFAKWNEKTAHRPFLPDFHKMGRGIYKIRNIALVIMILVVPFAYTAQGMNSFLFGNSAVGVSEGTQVYADEQTINEKFGRSNMLVAIYPNTSAITEKAMSDEIEDLEYVKSRMLIYIRTKSESDKAFEYTNDIRDIVKKYYPEDSYVAGETPSTQDIKTTITADNARVNVLSLISVFVVVMFSFQSVLVPIIVMIPIEAAIYINMAVPYLVGETLVYMGYIIVSSIQLGATVDYSILLTNNYMACRKTMKKKEAVVEALAMSCSSVFTSGTILILAGYIVYMISSTAAIGGLGHLIGRGALFSVCLVLTILPALLVLCDGIITSNEMDRFKKYLKRRHEKRKALVKSGIGAVKKKASAALARRGSQTAEVDGNEI